MFEKTETLEEFMEFVKSYKDKKDYHYSEVGKCDKALTDLDHELELKSLNGPGMLRYAKERKAVLLERRKNKDQLYILQELEKRFPNMTNVSNTLEGLIKSVQSLQKQLNERVYVPRILTEKFDVEQQLKEKRPSKVIKSIDELKEEYISEISLEAPVITNSDIEEAISKNDKLRNVDSGNIIKRRSEEQARIDALFEKIK